MKKFFSFNGLDWFIPALIAVVALAYFVPGPGMIQKPVSLSEIAGYGISLIFFFYGLKLNSQKLKLGLSNWRMHLVIQLTTFLLFPILALILKPFFISEEATHIWLGIFFLSALPSTVSSSAVMVSIAGGNIPGAIFNASISALIGVFVTPFWISVILSGETRDFDVPHVFIRLIVQVLLPVIIGMLLNKRFVAYTEKYKTSFKTFDQVVILLIVYTSFCKSFTGHLFDTISPYELILLAAGMLALFLAIVFLMKVISRCLRFNRSDTITVLFCGSKKSLVHGTVMSGILFAGNPLAGLILLPLILYHALQILAAGILAKKLAAGVE